MVKKATLNMLTDNKYTWIFFSFFPLLALLLTYAVIHEHQPTLSIYPNIIACLIGILLVFFNTNKSLLINHSLITAMLLLIFMLASLVSTGLNGVHRWISISNYHLNAAMLLMPMAIFIINRLITKSSILPLILTISFLLIFIIQPDASQATAFGFAVITLFAANKAISKVISVMCVVTILLGITFSWHQPDILPAVMYVEDMIYLIIGMGFVATTALLGIVIILIAPFIYMLKHGEDEILATSFLVYLCSEFIVTFFGNYPVPVIGLGISPILGWYLMLSLIS